MIISGIYHCSLKIHANLIISSTTKIYGKDEDAEESHAGRPSCWQEFQSTSCSDAIILSKTWLGGIFPYTVGSITWLDGTG